MFLSFLNLFRRPRCADCQRKIKRGQVSIRVANLDDFLGYRWVKLCASCYWEATKGFTD